MELEKIFNTEGIIELKMSIWENQIHIDKVFNGEKGAFRRFWNEQLIPFCKENDIAIITLVDRQTCDRDVWGDNYGFSGNKHSGQRIVYVGNKNDEIINDRVMNTMIDMVVSDLMNDMYEEDYSYNFGIKRLKLSSEQVSKCIEYAKRYCLVKEYKGNKLGALI